MWPAARYWPAATLATLAPAVAGGDAVFTLRPAATGTREYGRPFDTSDGFRE
ncbi:hypothetical protein BX281_9497 [Streptomyces sp. Ag82_O1-15]|nr:hypothetical protein BX281_9497 [Streptomyces sp. Ag82_O1-15]